MEIVDIIYIILAVILVIIFIIFIQYNRLIKLFNKVKEAKANIEIYLNKRFELIPNLVQCVKSYSKYEAGTLEEIVSLRNVYNEGKNLNIKQVEQMNNGLNRLLGIVENYPELKANNQFLKLQNQLSEIEDDLEVARKQYNNAVTAYNTVIELVPSNIIASIFAFKKTQLFQIENRKKENINLNL